MLPNLSDYMQTFQNPQLFLADRELVGCTCPKDQLGQPKVQSGGFALTFRLESPTHKWAVRCFHREVADRATRYTAITLKLNEPALRQSGYFVDFEYQPQGVTVKGEKYPIVKMSWASGVTLGSFLEANYNNPVRLRSLQESLRALYKFLSSQHIAHGDIQPGNLMVSNDGKKIQLIDYDGMFVPGMDKLSASETGVPNFQHPKRQVTNPWNDKLDRFPFIVLDIALSVLADKPQYWTKTQSSDEKVLFETTDYVAPLGSAIFNELKADVRYSQQIAALQQICLSDFDAIPPADNFIGFKAVITAPQAAAQAGPIQVWYKGNYPVADAVALAKIKGYEGHVVEIVGRVYDVHRGITRQGKPYYFINFARWQRGKASFRLVVWSEVLQMFAAMGVPTLNHRFKGQYISVTGLVVKFSNQNGVSYQIVLQKPTAISVISSDAADFRLGRRPKIVNPQVGGTLPANNSNVQKASPLVNSQKQHPVASASTDNIEKLKAVTDKLQKKYGQRRVATNMSVGTAATVGICSPSPSVSQKPLSNAEKLKRMKGGVGNSASQAWSSGAPSPRRTPKSGSSGGCLVPLVAIISALVLMGKAIAMALQ